MASARDGAPSGTLRRLLLAGAGIALLAGLWSGLARAGEHRAVGPFMAHGIFMVLGFLGTLVAVERAVALRSRRAAGAAACSVLATLGILLGLPRPATGALLVLGGALLTTAHGLAGDWREQRPSPVSAGSGLAWVLAAALWSAGWSPVRLAPVLAAFLVLALVGQRLEVWRARDHTAGGRAVVGACGMVGLAAAWTLVDRPTGLVAGGLAMAVLAVLLARHDDAARPRGRSALPRLVSVCLLAGYLWLGASGLLWVGLGVGVRGPLLYDAALHTLFLGFVISVTMGQVPTLLTTRGRPMRDRWTLWAPVVLLHLSVATRVVADLLGSTWGRGMSSHGNVTAILVYGVVVWRVARRRVSADLGADPGDATASGTVRRA